MGRPSGERLSEATRARRPTSSSELGRENRELKRANEILRKASSHSAQAELGSRGDSYDNALAETIIGL